MGDELFRSIENHLEHFGYRTKLEGGILRTTEAPLGSPVFWVVPHPAGGVVFRALYKTEATAKSDAEGFLKFLDDANKLAVVSRFIGFPDVNFMCVEAWFPPAYERHSFAIFFGRYLVDNAVPALKYPEAIAKFFKPASTPTPRIEGPNDGVQ